MDEKTHSRKGFRSIFIIALLTLYLIPILLMGPAGLQLNQESIPWRFFFFAAIFCSLGMAIFMILLRYWEQSIRKEQERKVRSAMPQEMPNLPLEGSPIDLKEFHALKEQYELTFNEQHQQLYSLKEELKSQQQELEAIHQGHGQLNQEWQGKEMEYRTYKEELEQRLSQKEEKLREFHQIYQEQKSLLQKKQERINLLENKIRDLTYEIRTLLQLEDMNQEQASEEKSDGSLQHPFIPLLKGESSAQNDEEWGSSLSPTSDTEVRTQYDAYVLLQKCIQVAQSLTGALHLGGSSSRFRDLSIDSYAIDLRRLFDSFRNETASVILVYSQGEGKLLFANNLVKTLFGWSPERFVKDFTSLLQGKKSEWETTLPALTPDREAHLRLVLRTKGGEDLLAHCCLGVVPAGAFQGVVIGVLYRA